MEKRLKRVELGVLITIVLIVFNVGYNIYQGTTVIKAQSSQVSGKVELPDDLTEKSMGGF